MAYLKSTVQVEFEDHCLSLVHLFVCGCRRRTHTHTPAASSRRKITLGTNTVSVRACAEGSRGAISSLPGTRWARVTRHSVGTALVVEKTAARLAFPGGTGSLAATTVPPNLSAPRRRSTPRAGDLRCAIANTLLVLARLL